MDIEAAIDSVNSFFKTAWELESTVPLKWGETPDNVIPDDNTGVSPQQVDPFVVVDTEIIGATQATLGAAPNRRFRRSGLMVIRIMTPQKQGRLLSDQLANIVFDSLEGECTPEGVELFNLVPLVGFRAGAFHVKQINVEFEYDEIK